jgi:tetratricopeptide (TPR) repeat protein
MMRLLLVLVLLPLAAQTASNSGRKSEPASDDRVRRLLKVLESSPPREIEGQARVELVGIFERRGDWSSAAAQLRALRELAPADFEYAYQLGVVYRNWSKDAFERMLAVAPQSARSQQAVGEQYAVMGDSGKAEAAYRRALDADPKLPGSHLALAVLYLRSGRSSEARTEIDRELDIAPESAAAKQVRQAIVNEDAH